MRKTIAGRLTDGFAAHLAAWPWTQTMIAVTLALTTFFVVGPFVLAWVARPLPSDYVMDLQRNMLSVMWPSVVAMAIGKRATTKVDVMEFDARQAAQGGGQ